MTNRTNGLTHTITIALAATLTAATQPAAADPAEFYKGKTLVMLVGSGAGGGYDTYTRLLSRHFSRHIPSQPRVIIQNMPGASGLVAMNHLYTIAPRDGTIMLGAHNTLPLEPLMGREEARFDPVKLSWIGSIGKQVNVCLVWHESPVKTLDEVFQKEVLVSSTGSTGWRSILPRLYNATAGSRFRLIEGYSTTGSMLAVERREVDGICTTYETLASTQQDWLDNKKIRFLAQFGLKPLPELTGVPLGLDRVRDPKDLEAIRLVMSQQEFGRPYVAPPDVPKDRLEALRTAFDATIADKDFMADANKARLNVDPMKGPEIEDLIRKIYAAPKDTVARSRKLMASARAK